MRMARSRSSGGYLFCEGWDRGMAPSSFPSDGASTDPGAVQFCYDAGDKLTSPNDARYPTLAYDTRGNTT
jgi:hypothetical protein